MARSTGEAGGGVLESPYQSSSFLARHSFLLRRLHSLSGLVPVGAYLVVHLFTNASVLAGPAAYQANVDRIHALGPMLPFVEWIFIFIPLIFHSLYGFVRIYDSQTNSAEYPYPRNIRYTLQRISGIVAFAFILWHVLQLHHLGFGMFEAEHATSSAAAAVAPGFWMVAWYAVGVTASVFHLANGIWTFGLTWGIWTSPAAQRRADYVCAGLGAVVLVIGLGSLVGMGSVDIDEARRVEERLLRGKRILAGELPLEAAAPAAAASQAVDAPH